MHLADLRKRAPFFGVVLSLICGVLLYSTEYRFLARTFLLCASSFWAVAFVYHIIYNKSARKTANILFRWLVLLLFGICGWLLAYCYDHTEKAKELASGRQQVLRFLVDDVPQQRGNSIRVDGVITHVLKQGKWQEVQIGCRAYFKDLQPLYGDVWLLKTELTRPDSAFIPFMFDLRAHLQNKGIDLTCRIRNQYAQRLEKNQGIWYKNLAVQIRQYSLQTIDIMDRDSLNSGVIKALLLGYRNDLDETVTESFSKTGVVHVLAVSGMHVGIIYMVMAFLFSPLRKFKRGNIFVSLGIVLLLWLFALVAGFSPSVNRAALMFSVVQFGTLLGRRAHIFNSLAFSALIMIIFNPYVIFQAGFQLSYAAVIGIVVASDSLIRLLKPSDWLGQKFVELAAVSVGAQLATFPLGILYFHQLSLVFLLANIVVLPFIPLILYLSLASIVIWLGGASEVAVFIFELAESYVSFIRSIVMWMDSFFWSSLGGVYMSKPQVILLYAMMLLVAIIPESIKARRLQSGIILLCLLLYIGKEYQMSMVRQKFHGRWSFDYFGKPALVVANPRTVKAFLPVEMLLKDPNAAYHTSGLNAFLKCKTRSLPITRRKITVSN